MRFRTITAEGTEYSFETVEELTEEIASGRLQPNGKLFDSALDRWSTASEHDAAAAVFALLQNPVLKAHAPGSHRAAAVAAAHKASANRRIVARFLDGLIVGLPFTMLIAFLSGMFLGAPTSESDIRNNQLFWTIVSWLGVMIVDPYCLMHWRGSPGKLLLGMRVASTNSAPLTWGRAWRRSISMWANGLACGIPIIQLIPAAVAMRKVASGGCATWDREAGTDVLRET